MKTMHVNIFANDLEKGRVATLIVFADVTLLEEVTIGWQSRSQKGARLLDQI